MELFPISQNACEACENLEFLCKIYKSGKKRGHWAWTEEKKGIMGVRSM